MNNRNVRSNLRRLKGKVPKAKLHIRIPRIPEYNDDNKVKQSVKKIKDLLGVEPEVFDYIKTPEIKRYSWLDDDDVD